LLQECIILLQDASKKFEMTEAKGQRMEEKCGNSVEM
jgi:hypothetical protein